MTEVATGFEEALRRELEEARTQLTELNKIGMALMSERDPDKLLGLILTQARRLTNSDAGSLYLVETDDAAGAERLHFLRSQNDTLPHLPSPDFTLPLDETSIAGYVANTGAPLVLDDVYEMPADLPFSFNKAAFDEKYGYRAKSMLVVPMVDHRDRVVGVLQLINRKSDASAAIRTDEDSDAWVLPYTDREVSVVQSLAGQAAVSIENGRLYQDITRLFEGMVKAASTAIDQRDPSTAGHSRRVTKLTCLTAELINEQNDGPFKDVHFTEQELKQLEYAGYLHDFGKVGVREEVLVKAKKLPVVLEAEVRARFQLIRRTMELEASRARADLLVGDDDEEAVAALDRRLEADLARVDAYRTAVEEANIPRVLPEAAAGVLQEIAATTFTAPDGTEQPYITAAELHYLSIPKGSLDDSEREQIQSHVVQSCDFLARIPWTEEFARLIEIVRGHHEKLNGGGYPDGVTGDRLSIETRIMTVCDIYEALTANRHYKKGLPVEKALSILRMEADEGALDPDIVELFCTSGVYDKAPPEI
jgi:HD-GYP domain-containing protein (c-di-GMP phosphodiesterase class II)